MQYKGWECCSATEHLSRMLKPLGSMLSSMHAHTRARTHNYTRVCVDTDFTTDHLFCCLGSYSINKSNKSVIGKKYV